MLLFVSPPSSPGTPSPKGYFSLDAKSIVKVTVSDVLKQASSDLNAFLCEGDLADLGFGEVCAFGFEDPEFSATLPIKCPGEDPETHSCASGWGGTFGFDGTCVAYIAYACPPAQCVWGV